MCTYNISIEEDVMEKVRPSIASGVSEEQWLQYQVNMLIEQILTSQNNKNRVYLENGEVKFNIVTDYLSIEEAKEFTKKAIDLEYSLP